ncbi:hypothetical protein KKA08_03070 [bacterium]|nr:hypothetical protein [bacterium]
MSEPHRKYSEETAWLGLMHTRGIGVKRGWKVHHFLRERGLGITDLYSEQAGSWRIPGISESLMLCVRETEPQQLVQREKQLREKALTLLYPGASQLQLPVDESLPPTLVYWGDLALLRSPRLIVLLNSRKTPQNILQKFLQINAAADEEAVWCSCPFSQQEWDIVEGLMKAGDSVLLGSVSGIPRRAVMLCKDYPDVSVGVFTPEPRLKSRYAHFSCLEGCYRLLFRLAKRILVISMQPGSRTAKRVKTAENMGFEVTLFEDNGGGSSQSRRAAVPAGSRQAAEKSEKGWENSPSEDDGFISCL